MEAVRSVRCFTGLVSRSRARSSTSSSSSSSITYSSPCKWVPTPRLRSSVLLHPHPIIRYSPSPPPPLPSSAPEEEETDAGNAVSHIQTASDQSQTVNVKFVLRRACLFGQQFFVVGNHPSLSLWDPSKAISMQWSDGHVWSAELDLPVGKSIQFKFVLQGFSREIHWQPGPDRVLRTWETKNRIVIYEEWENVDNQKIVEEEPLAMLTEEPISEVNKIGINGIAGSVETQEGASDNICKENMADEKKPPNCEGDFVLVPGLAPISLTPTTSASLEEHLDGKVDDTSVASDDESRSCGGDFVLVPGLAPISISATTSASSEEHLDGKVDDTLIASNDESRTALQLSGQQEEPEVTSRKLIEEHTVMKLEKAHEVDNSEDAACFEEDNSEVSRSQPMLGVIGSDLHWGIKILHQLLLNLGFQSIS